MASGNGCVEEGRPEAVDDTATVDGCIFCGEGEKSKPWGLGLDAF